MAERKVSVRKEIASSLLILFSVALIVFLLLKSNKFQEKKAEYNNYVAINEKLVNQKKVIEKRLDKLEKDPNAQEKAIRDKLKYAKPTDIILQNSEKGDIKNGKLDKKK